MTDTLILSCQDIEDGGTEWCEAVSDDEYNKVKYITNTAALGRKDRGLRLFTHGLIFQVSVVFSSADTEVLRLLFFFVVLSEVPSVLLLCL